MSTVKPSPTLPDLPILTAVPALRTALASGHVVLSAEPGSGKTTLVPLLLLDETWLAGRRILILQPRRPAARMAARRMARLLGEDVGATVGYQVRFERRVSAHTRIEVLTEGLLLRRLQADPSLEGVGLVVFDEFHERSLQADLALALCLDVCAGLRDDLRLLAMSASLDVAPLTAMLGAQAVAAQGRCHPVEVLYADSDGDRRDPLPATRRALQRALAECDGDVLVFLPGRREIERLRQWLAEDPPAAVRVQVLYGDLSAAEQDAVLQGPAGGRRVILSTDIAETSLTIEGIGAVVDAGLARRPVFDPRTGLSRLETQWISKASALQRAGRAGRLGPGRCYRAWHAARQARLADFSPPEIADADLAALVLELAAWGVGDATTLRWLDPPPTAHWGQARALLEQLGALDVAGRITATGRAMLRLPTHPRLAHLLTAAHGEAAQRQAADLAALLAEPDPMRRTRDAGADLGRRLDLLRAWREHRRLPTGVEGAALQRIDRAQAQLLRLCPGRDDADGAPIETAAGLGVQVARAYPDRIAACTSADGRRYLLRNGRGALLDESDPLRGTPLLAIADLDAGQREGRIWLAAPITAAELAEAFDTAIVARRELRWDARLGDLVARAVRRLDALLLADEPVALRADDPVEPLLIAQVRAQGLGAFFRDPVTLRARVATMRRLDPQGDWPDLSDEALLETLETWLGPWLRPGVGVRQLRALDLGEILSAGLGWERQRRLDAWLPTHIETPAGTRRAIGYSPDAAPVLAVPLQEVLGLSETPRLAEGRQPLLLHLLSPAGRPLQVTADLAAFWAGAYDAVKKEMRGRYPKHYWPDDPASAQATRFTKRRMSRDGD